MAVRKVQIEIDEDLVRRARERVAGDESDSDAVARALTVYEVRAHRASRGRAA